MLYEFDYSRITDGAATSATDEQLMSLIQERDEDALAVFHRRHRIFLRSIVSSVLHHDHDTDDVIQEVLLELWNRADRYIEARGKALGWVVTLARRRAIDRVRRRLAYRRTEERNRLETSCAHSRLHPGADEDVQKSDRAAVLRQILRSIPAAQREAMEMAFYRGMTQRQIAASTGVPLGTIKTRLELALGKVKTAILALGGRHEWDLSLG